MKENKTKPTNNKRCKGNCSPPPTSRLMPSQSLSNSCFGTHQNVITFNNSLNSFPQEISRNDAQPQLQWQLEALVQP